ncbi:MAG: hypothetical protein HC828_12695 [Blastochloris sp.]|nr:hypothetical protein [Blastochloris sp.]
MPFTNENDAINFIFQSMRTRLGWKARGPDEIMRDPTPTTKLLGAHGLLNTPREYAVVTGSKGKGSTTVITAKLLQHIGHTVGTVTSPHLVSWRERIRVNGRAIPQDDFLRILSDLQPTIESIDGGLQGQRYFSPQGIFLAIALQWFDEQGVNAAVLEVGRGGRFDDIAVVPNKVSLFTPIMLEHVAQLGSTLDRIAWHKAGIIKPMSFAYSVPQATEVLSVLQTEADAQNAEFAWIAPMDMGEYLATTERGVRMRLGRYGDLDLSLMGSYQIENATLAVQGAGSMHGRLPGISHGSREYVEAIRAGLADVTWPGRLQKLDEQPAIYIDGATTVTAARAFLDSLRDRLTEPLVTIVATPVDRDYPGVYSVFGPVSRLMILTENSISMNVQFPDRETALAAARQHSGNLAYADTLSQAVTIARTAAGRDGTILIAVAQPVVGEAVQLWGLSWEQI